MKATTRRLWALLAIGAVTSTAMSATIDIPTYLGLKPGTWAIYQDTASGAISGYVASVDGAGQVAQTWYTFNGSSWVLDEIELFTMTSRRFSFIGVNDGTATWLLEPTLTAPRRQQVNDSTVYEGVLRNQSTGQAVPITTALSITADGLSVGVPAGTFTNCIKLRNYTYQSGTSRDSVSISCANRPGAKGWYNKIKDTPDPTVEDQSQSRSSVMIQGGDSGAPFP